MGIQHAQGVSKCSTASLAIFSQRAFWVLAHWHIGEAEPCACVREVALSTGCRLLGSSVAGPKSDQPAFRPRMGAWSSDLDCRRRLRIRCLAGFRVVPGHLVATSRNSFVAKIEAERKTGNRPNRSLER